MGDLANIRPIQIVKAGEVPEPVKEKKVYSKDLSEEDIREIWGINKEYALTPECLEKYKDVLELMEYPQQGDYYLDSKGEELMVITQDRPLRYNRLYISTRESVWGHDSSLELDYASKWKKCPDLDKAMELAQSYLDGNLDLGEFQNQSEALISIRPVNDIRQMKAQAEQHITTLANVKRYCNAIQTRLREEMNAKMSVLQKQMSEAMSFVGKVQKVISVIETYLGVNETVEYLKLGEPAPLESKIIIRQATIFADEEMRLIDQNFDYRKMESFDAWLLENDNYKLLVPEERCIVALKPRRERVKYTEDSWVNAIMNKPNFKTYFLIRNGENLYKIRSENIEVGTRLMPAKDEMQKVIDKMNAGDKWAENEKDNFNNTYLPVLALIRGLVERSEVFSPHKCRMPESFGFIQDDPAIQVIYELDGVLSDGKPLFRDWKAAINNKIKEGSRILWLDGYDSRKDLRGRFVRYYDNEWNIPDGPNTGVYQVVAATEEDKRYRGYEFKFAYLPGDKVWTKERYRYDQVSRTKRVLIMFSKNDINVFNFDEIDIADVDYYLNSRLHKSAYYGSVCILQKFKEFWLKEKEQENVYINMICSEFRKRGYEVLPFTEDGIKITEEVLVRRSLKIVKDRLKWKRPVTVKDRETFALICKNLFSKANIAKYMKQLI